MKPSAAASAAATALLLWLVACAASAQGNAAAVVESVNFNNISTYNIFGYRNTAADKWFDAVRFAANDAEYRAAASQLQRTLHEDPPALFLAWSERTRAVSRRFNVNAEPGRDPMQRSWQWTPLNVRLNSTN